MQQAIDEAGVISSVGFQQRFDHRHEAMQQFLDDKQVVMAQYVMHAPLEAHSVKHTLDGAIRRAGQPGVDGQPRVVGRDGGGGGHPPA